MPRKNYLLGRWVKHSGWNPDYRQPQLFRQGRLSYTLEEVHEGFICDGPIGHLTQPIWQFPFENLEQMLHKAQRYSTLGAQKSLKVSKWPGPTGVMTAHLIFFSSSLWPIKGIRLLHP